MFSNPLFRMIILLIFVSFFILGCGKVPFDAVITYDLDSLGVPKLITADFTDLSKIYKISKFRSSIGHDSSDSFEQNRSMKHYFYQKPEFDGTTASVECYAPAAGEINMIWDEGEIVSGEVRGKQIHLRPRSYPGFIIIMFHINPRVSKGDVVSAGQLLGYFDCRSSSFDISVSCSTFMGQRLFSYFDVITDQAFSQYISRGVSSREAMIISKEYRDANPADFNHSNSDESFVLN